MDWLRRIFHVPASETQTGIVLAVCIFAMSIMSVMLVWQAQIIARQNAVIRMFQSRLGGGKPVIAHATSSTDVSILFSADLSGAM